jgi:hypothetical protein
MTRLMVILADVMKCVNASVSDVVHHFVFSEVAGYAERTACTLLAISAMTKTTNFRLARYGNGYAATRAMSGFGCCSSRKGVHFSSEP